MNYNDDLKRRNRRVGFFALLIVFGMVGLSLASLPLYRAFCSATGYNGTPTPVPKGPINVTDRKVTIEFNADVSPELDWDFKPEQRTMQIYVGQKAMAAFRAVNLTDHAITGSAIYNVLPLKVGKYFHKIQCFCFGQQTLGPHQDAHMPVVFFVDPAFANDIDMQDVTQITLSYTFFKTDTPALEQATERFYNRSPAAVK
jgi:cytochrome c oxidase assembly protein subunit 11